MSDLRFLINSIPQSSVFFHRFRTNFRRMTEKFISYYISPFGELEICTSEKALISLNYLPNGRKTSFKEDVSLSDDLAIILETKKQLDEYFAGERKGFDLPLDLIGTEFQQKVWGELLKIPFGRTISYIEMAKNLGDEKVIRAAASANGKNPVMIIVPCHRVIGNDGKLVGYAGGLSTKKWLLDHENRLANGVLELFG